MKNLIVITITILISLAALAGVKVLNSSSTNLGQFHTVKCSTGVTCTNDGKGVMKIVTSDLVGPVTISGDLSISNGVISGDGTSALFGFREALSQNVSGSVTVLKTACGTNYISNGSTSATLPEASTVLGCEYGFFATTAASTDVNPADATDMIIYATNASGDATQFGGAAGKFLILKAIGSDLWVPSASQGTVIDIN